jgi:hypothetical protein
MGQNLKKFGGILVFRGQKTENSDYVFVDEYDFTIIKIKICLT